jgi:3-phosphoglycerate kinase
MSNPMSTLVDCLILGGVVAALFLVAVGVIGLLAFGFGF